MKNTQYQDSCVNRRFSKRNFVRTWKSYPCLWCNLLPL